MMDPSCNRRDLLKFIPASLLSTRWLEVHASEDILIERAIQSVREGAADAAADPAHPIYHFTPLSMWMNDLNGGLFHNGWYHLFYNHDPFDARGESPLDPKWLSRLPARNKALKMNRYWGHTRSQDFVHWEHLPMALGPALDLGELKPISGSSIITAKGQPLIFYTSVGLERAITAVQLASEWVTLGAPLLRPKPKPDFQRVLQTVSGA